MIAKCKNKTYYMLALIIILSACTTNSPISTPSSSQSVPPPTALTLPTVSADAIETIVAQPDYMRSCRGYNSIIANEQVEYRGITPGMTTPEEVKSLVGKPLSESILIDQWGYEGYAVTFENSTVSEINVVFDPEFLLPLMKIVEEYGCPDVIFAYDSKEERTGELDALTFVYHNSGVEFIFYSYPTSPSKITDMALLFKGESLHEYLVRISYLLAMSDTIKLVSWDEVVTK